MNEKEKVNFIADDFETQNADEKDESKIWF